MSSPSKPPRSPGRPRLPAGSHRCHQIGIRLTSSELSSVRARADAAGLRPSVYVRHLALTGKANVVEVRALVRAVNRLGTNLNQLVRYSHQRRELPSDRTLEALRADVAALRALIEEHL